jgi:glycosyltransferase involved in cell wall biosynthesis
MRVNQPSTRIDVIDPRGQGSAAMSIVRLAIAAFQLVMLRMVHGSEILHLQVSERLSFFRKGTLLLLGRLLRMRIVLHHHGAELIPFYRDAKPITKRFVRWVAMQADVNIVLGEVWRRFLIEELGIPESRIEIRLNAAEDMKGRRRADPSNRLKLLLPANLSPRKGVSELLQAVSQLSSEGMPVTLTLAGGGQIDRYQEEASRLGIADRCTFTGWISGQSFRDLFLSHGALVLPSHNEGFPMTIIEALSAGLPVITTRVGSIPEVLRHEFTCIFVATKDVIELSAGIRRIANSPGLADELAANGRELYDRVFSIESYMNNLFRDYLNILHGHINRAS